MDKVTNILMVGVGGQGVILASDIVADVVMSAGFDVKKSEVHGMAQRGGSVFSHIRFGSKVHSPVIKKGEADIMVSFEQLETVRYLDFITPDSIVLLNNQKIMPLSVNTGEAEYPSDIPRYLSDYYPRFELIDAVTIACEAGAGRALNMVLLGVLSGCFALEEDLWQSAIRSFVPPRLQEVNLSAFSMGRQLNNGKDRTALSAPS